MKKYILPLLVAFLLFSNIGYAYTDLIITNTTTWCGNVTGFDYLEIKDGGKLLVCDSAGKFNVTANQRIVINGLVNGSTAFSFTDGFCEGNVRTDGFGGGGGGGGHNSVGATGANIGGGAGGAIYGLKTTSSFETGCHGGSGLDAGGCGTGGKGGGSLGFNAPSIKLSNTIDVRGRSGESCANYGGGGGSAGQILFNSIYINLTGELRIGGGGGGGGGSGAGGVGSDGRIKVFSDYSQNTSLNILTGSLNNCSNYYAPSTNYAQTFQNLTIYNSSSSSVNITNSYVNFYVTAKNNGTSVSMVFLELNGINYTMSSIGSDNYYYSFNPLNVKTGYHVARFYANDSDGRSWTNYTTYFSTFKQQGGIDARVYDEQNASAAITAYNVVISNSTTSSTFNSYNNVFNKTYDLVPNGEVTISVSKTDWTTRDYYGTISDSSYVNLTAYLLNYSLSTKILFHVFSIVGFGVQNATVNVNRLIGSSYQTVGHKLTDGTGTAEFYLDNTILYQLVVSATGYNTLTTTIAPVQTDINVPLISDIQNTFTSYFYDIGWYHYPDTVFVANNSQQYFYMVINSTNNSLSSFGINLIYWNGTSLCNTSSTNVYGGMVLCNVNLTAMNQTLTLYTYFTKVGYPIQNTSWIYRIYEPSTSNSTLDNVMQTFQTVGVDNLFINIIIIIVVIAVTGLTATTGLGIEGGAIIGFLVVCFFAAYGFVGELLVIAIGIIAIVLFIIGRVR